MNRPFSCRVSSGTRNCRNSCTRSGVKAEAWAEQLERQWQGIRRHASIEKDPEKLLRLTTELEKRKRPADAASSRNGN